VTAVPSEEIRRSLAAQRRYDRQAALFDVWEAPMEMLAFGRLRRALDQSVWIRLRILSRKLLSFR